MVNLVGKSGVKKKLEKKNQRGNKGSLKVNESSAKIHKGQKKDVCHFCKKIGHCKKDCLKHKIWFEKKGKLIAFVCFKSNLAEVPCNTWWIDFGCITHVSNTMQGFLMTQTTRLTK